MPTINDIYESKSNYLRVEDLQKRKVNVTIKDAVVETVGEDKKIVLHFVEAEKVLPLNITNARMIAMLLGTEDYENWKGTRITLKPSITTWKGQPTECIRIDEDLPEQLDAKGQAAAFGSNVPQRGVEVDPNTIPF